MQYEKEIDELFVHLFREEGDTDEEYQEFLGKVLEETGITKEDLNEQLEEGVSNGYPVDVQMDLVRQAFEPLKLNKSALC